MSSSNYTFFRSFLCWLFVDITSLIHFSGQHFNNISQFLIESSDRVTEITNLVAFDTVIEASDCYTSSVSLALNYEPNLPQFFELYSSVIFSNDDSIAVTCRDEFGFVVSCQNLKFDVIYSTLDIKISNCTETSCSIYISPSYTLGNHLFAYETFFNFDVFVSSMSFTLVQAVRQELFVTLLGSSPCDENNFDELTCTIFKLNAEYNIYFDTSFYSANVSLLSLTILSDFTVLHIGSNSFGIISPPLIEIQLLFSYESSTVFMSPIALDCQFPKIFSNGRCVCDLGYQLSQSSGYCELCFLNSFSDISAPQVCRNCPHPRVT
ncbi:hypothetical protein GEMRC1_001478 [Eukaryota sp. GEM-RC1]